VQGEQAVEQQVSVELVLALGGGSGAFDTQGLQVIGGGFVQIHNILPT
jgi:hypothetical protein